MISVDKECCVPLIQIIVNARNNCIAFQDEKEHAL
jgi:hypothetical protein